MLVGYAVDLRQSANRNQVPAQPNLASRGKNIAPVEVDGMNDRDSRLFLDELEAHVLQPK